MKKLLSKLVITVIALCLTLPVLMGCTSNWNKGDITLPMEGAGAVKEETLGGFIVETENYVYFINGLGTSSSDNSFGAPVKGSLVAADKNDLSKTCIIVPKLFVASDYNAGVYIFDGYVYYGTPSTDKTASGSVAYSELQFMRTKLDGTETTAYFKASSLSAEYRIVKGEDGVVYIVYYDTTDAAIKSYNISTRTATVVAKTDDTATESLASYKFVKNQGIEGAVVVYTTTVYKDEYNKDEAEANEDYKRNTEKFNKVYAYKAGETAKCVLDDQNKTYTITNVYGNYVFYKETDILTSGEKTYAITTADLFAKEPATLIDNASYVADTNVIVSLDEVYILEDSSIKVSTLVGDNMLTEKTVAENSSISKLLFKNGDYMYFINSSTEISRIYIGDTTGEDEYSEKVLEQKVSDGKVNNSWFAPEIIDGKIFYLDVSDTGVNYVACVDITADNSEVPFYCEDDDCGEIEYYYLENQTSVAVMTEQDKASVVTAQISALSEVLDVNGRLVLDENDKVKQVSEVREAYDSLKNKSSVANYQTLKNYEEAIKVSVALKGLDNFDKARTTAEKDAFKTVYESAKTVIDALKASDFDYKTVMALTQGNLHYFYTLADTYFTAE